jgi:tetratricopeptide (TPR) repeat protein
VEESFPDQNEIRADVHAEMSVVFLQLGDFPEAEFHARQSLEIRRQVFGLEHPETLRAHNDLADVLLEWGTVRRPGAGDEAERLLVTALAVTRALPDEMHELTIGLLAKKVSLAFSRQNFEEAEQLTREALDLGMEYLQPDSPTLLDQEHNLAILLAQGRGLDEAAARLEDLLERRVKTQGAHHPDTLKTQRDFATALKNLDRLEEAETQLRDLLPIQEEVMGEDHPEVIMVHNQLAHCLRLQSRTAAAADGFSFALDLAQQRLGTDHYLTLQLMDSLAATWEMLGEREEAEELHWEGYEHFLANYGINNPLTQAKGHRVSLVLLRHLKFELALGLIEELLAAADSDQACVLLAAKARGLLGLGRVDEAKELISANWSGLQRATQVPTHRQAVELLVSDLRWAGWDDLVQELQVILDRRPK